MRSYRVTPYFRSISINNPALERQFTPDEREGIYLDYETEDPLYEGNHTVSNRLVHRYRDRVLLLATDNCRLYCRHCFRRDYIDRGQNNLSDRDIEDACSYIKEHSEVHEILISGGDPLTLGAERLDYLLTRLKEARTNLVIRIGTRAPIVDPDIITDKITAVFKKFKPVFMAIQVNHPDELTNKVEVALDKLSKAGVILLNQSVLLKGINDSVETLKALSFKLLEFRVKPYYLFQGDLARGTSHLRVPLSRGLQLVRELRSQVSGIAMPTYAVDIPGGGGKIPLTGDYITGEDDDYFYLRNSEGFTGRYPKEN